MGNILQYTGFFQLIPFFIGNTALDHFKEQVCQMQCLVLVLTDDQFQHHIRGSLGNRAAISLKSTVYYHIVLYLQLQENVISAAGIHAFQYQIGILQFMLVIRMQIMLRQNFVIKCLILHSPSVSLSLQGLQEMPESLLPYCRPLS